MIWPILLLNRLSFDETEMLSNTFTKSVMHRWHKMPKIAYFCLAVRKWQMFKSVEKTKENNEIRSGSPNIPNLRTFAEFIYALRNDKIIFQVQKLIS